MRGKGFARLWFDRLTMTTRLDIERNCHPELVEGRALPAGRSGPRCTLIRLQALGARPVSAAIANACIRNWCAGSIPALSTSNALLVLRLHIRPDLRNVFCSYIILFVNWINGKLERPGS